MSYRHSSPSVRRYQSGPSYSYNPFRPGRTILWTTIGACSVVFGAWQYAKSAGPPTANRSWWPSKAVESSPQKVNRFLVDNFLLSERHIAAGKYWTLFTSALSHRTFDHFLFNMFSLHAFSTVIIQAVRSPVHLGSLMIGSALAGSAGFLYDQSRKVAGVPSVGLGASGMVMGIGMAAAMLRPRTPMALFGVIPAPLWAILGGYVAIDTYYLDNTQSRIGHAAHLGGAAFGALYYALVLRRYGGVLAMLGK